MTSRTKSTVGDRRPLSAMLRRRLRALPFLSAALCISALAAGCAVSPQDHLQGRWFSESMSIRFRPDGSVIYNSLTTGMTTGRYYFDGELRPEASTTPISNLTLDLSVNGRPQRWVFEVQFLGKERLRLQPVRADRRNRAADDFPSVFVLSKAADDDTATLAATH